MPPGSHLPPDFSPLFEVSCRMCYKYFIPGPSESCISNLKIRINVNLRFVRFDSTHSVPAECVGFSHRPCRFIVLLNFFCPPDCRQRVHYQVSSCIWVESPTLQTCRAYQAWNRTWFCVSSSRRWVEFWKCLQQHVWHTLQPGCFKDINGRIDSSKVVLQRTSRFNC